ncbi:MAG: hypothetical protein VCB26_02680 [Candidatus Hydrogenedentota bacterium]
MGLDLAHLPPGLRTHLPHPNRPAPLSQDPHPRWHYALWMLVLIRMVMPIGLEAPWSVFNLFKTDPPVETPTLTPLPPLRENVRRVFQLLPTCLSETPW